MNFKFKVMGTAKPPKDDRQRGAADMPHFKGGRLSVVKKGVQKGKEIDPNKKGNVKHGKIVSHKNRIRSLERLLSRVRLLSLCAKCILI